MAALGDCYRVLRLRHVKSDKRSAILPHVRGDNYDDRMTTTMMAGVMVR